MPTTDEIILRVQQAWDGWKTAEVRLTALADVHWRQPVRAPRTLVHGYILCTDIISGEIPHACEQTRGPHRLLVCVLKRHSPQSAYEELVRRADQRSPSLADRPAVALAGRTRFAATRARA